MKRFVVISFACLSLLQANAQLPEGFEFPKPTPGDTLTSVRVNPDRSVTFSIYAPEARTVKLGGDMAGWGSKAPVFKKDENGIWSAVCKNDRIGTFRYNFVVDGVEVNDPRNPDTKSLRPTLDVDPSGDSFFAKKNVPHGAVSLVYYESKTFGTTRQMHIWTPAGYNKNNQKLPVLYLIHGGGDNDYAWPNVGRANFILDNLLAEGKIVPMVVVMPDGNVDVEKFTSDVMNDIIPFVEANYNVYTDYEHRALAGLSMGGLETLDISLNNYKSFAYVFPMSTGWFLGSEFYSKWEPYLKEHGAEMNKYFKIYRFYMGGEADIAYKNCIGTRELFAKYGIKHEYSSMDGGHSWYVWSNNLHDFAPLLFK